MRRFNAQHFHAQLYDGRTAKALNVTVLLARDELRIVGAGGSVTVWPLSAVRQVEGSFPGEPVRLARGVRRLEALSISDRGILDALKQSQRLAPGALLAADGTEKLLAQAVCALLALVTIATWANLTVVPRLAVAAVACIPPSFDSALRRSYERSLSSSTNRGSDAQALGLSRIVARLLQGGEAVTFKYGILVNTKRDDFNASAFPGGLLMVNQGALDKLASPEELAGILAHEIAHVERRHGIRSEVQLLIAAPLVSILLAADAGPQALLNSAVELGASRHSREDEFEADRLGMQRLLAVGIDPDAMIEEFTKNRGHAKRSVWSSHPHWMERVQQLRRIARGARGPFTPIALGTTWNEVAGRPPAAAAQADKP